MGEGGGEQHLTRAEEEARRFQCKKQRETRP